MPRTPRKPPGLNSDALRRVPEGHGETERLPTRQNICNGGAELFGAGRAIGGIGVMPLPRRQ